MITTFQNNHLNYVYNVIHNIFLVFFFFPTVTACFMVSFRFYSILYRHERYYNFLFLLVFFLLSVPTHFIFISYFSPILFVHCAIYKTHIHVCLTPQWNNPITLAMVNDLRGKDFRIQMVVAAVKSGKKIFARILLTCLYARKLINARMCLCFPFILCHSIVLMK